MSKIWFTSDTHFCHNRDFMFCPRGFTNIQDHDETIQMLWNDLIAPDDDVYLLGDVFLMDNNKGLELFKSLNGNIHIILGNHDTESRIDSFIQCENVVSISYAERIKLKKYIFILSHCPMLVHNCRDNAPVWNLHGHTHSPDKFSEFYHCYNVALDAHNNRPVELDEIIQDIQGVNYEDTNFNN